MSYHQIIEKLQKLKQLAERGEVNEKDTAHKKLVEMLVKYGISPEEIENPKVTERTFSFKTKDSFFLLSQVIWSVSSEAKVSFSNKLIYCYLSYSEFIEVKEKYKFYWQKFKEESSLFAKAFVYNNNLLPNNAAINTIEKEDEIGAMMLGLKKHNYIPSNKKIKNK